MWFGDEFINRNPSVRAQLNEKCTSSSPLTTPECHFALSERETMSQKQKRSMRNSKKKQRRGRAVNIARAGVFPPTLTRVLNYSDLYTLTEGAAGTGSFQIFRADAYDPDYSGVGHQPMYFDQLCTSVGPYLLYSVLKAQFQLKFVNTSAYPVMLVAYPSMANTSPSSRVQACEKPYAWKKLLPPVGTGGAATSHVVSIDCPRFVGLPRSGYIPSYSGSYAGAGNCPYCVVALYGQGGVASVTVEANILLTTHFYQLGPQSTS